MLVLKLATRLARPVAPAGLRSRSFTSTSALLSKPKIKTPISIPPSAKQRIFPSTIREYERLLAEDPGKAEDVYGIIITYCETPGWDDVQADHEAQEQSPASSEEKKSDSGKDE